jgi:site-specific DNA-methyltransferase (adenine-specific)
VLRTEPLFGVSAVPASITARAMESVTIGRATLYLGDCRDILPTLGKVDAVVTDPPYAVSVAGSFQKGIPGKGTRRLDFFEGDSDWAAMNRLVAEAVEHALDRDPLVFAAWCGHRQIGFITEALEARSFSTRLLFWRKKCPPPAPPGSGFSSAVECCVYGYKPGRPWNGGQYDFNVFETDNYRHGQPGKVDHPTQKPRQLMKWQVERVTAANSTILDPFMGSGSTGVAAVELDRDFIGIEREPKFFHIACERIREAQRQGKLFGEAA